MNNDRNIRRLQVALHSRGEGAILFSLWSGLEAVLMLLSASTLTNSAAYIPDDADPTLRWLLYILFFGMLVLILGGNLALNIYIGRAAIGFSHGKPFRKAPLVWCGLYAGLYVIAVLYGIVSSLTGGSLLLRLISCVPDIFVAVLHIQIVVFSRRLKKAEA